MGTELRMSPSLLETFAIQLQLRYFWHLHLFVLSYSLPPFWEEILSFSSKAKRALAWKNRKYFENEAKTVGADLLHVAVAAAWCIFQLFLEGFGRGYKLNIF